MIKKALPIAIATTMFLAGCGVNNEDANKQAAQDLKEQQAKERTAEQKAQANKKELPARPSGIVAVDGQTRGSLTVLASRRYTAEGGSTTVRIANNNENRAFAALCAGTLDFVDSARPISRSEWEKCKANGLDVVQFQIASDAIVIAARSETDFGADCLTTTQVKDMYRAGSPIYNWNQLGFDNVPMRVSGPNENNNAFSFFGRYILGSPQPSLSDFRSDYVNFETDRGVREFVVGSARDLKLAQELTARQRRVAQLESQVEAARESLIEARAEVKEAESQRRKGIKDKRSAAQQRKDQARQDRSYTARSRALVNYNYTKERLKTSRERAERAAVAKRRNDAVRGRVGFFRFSYYELYEEQLRPMEITLPNGQRNCIFPSQRTVTNAVYPFARQLLITTTTRSLERAEARSFLRSYLDNSQDLAEEQRLVPLPDATLQTERAWIGGDTEPTIVSYDNQRQNNATNTNPAAPAPTTPAGTTPEATPSQAGGNVK